MAEKKAPKAPKKASAPKAPKAPKTEPRFDVTIEVNSQVYNAKTDDIAAFILSLDIFFVKTSTLITIKSGGTKISRRLFIAQSRKMFRNKTSALLVAKNLQLALNVR